MPRKKIAYDIHLACASDNLAEQGDNLAAGTQTVGWRHTSAGGSEANDKAEYAVAPWQNVAVLASERRSHAVDALAKFSLNTQ